MSASLEDHESYRKNYEVIGNILFSTQKEIKSICNGDWNSVAEK